MIFVLHLAAQIQELQIKNIIHTFEKLNTSTNCSSWVNNNLQKYWMHFNLTKKKNPCLYLVLRFEEILKTDNFFLYILLIIINSINI